MKKLLFSLFVAVFVATNLFASDIEVDGIWYDMDDTNLTASVTYKGSSSDNYSNEYTGSVVIPTSITYNNKTYSVTTIGKLAFYKCIGLTLITIPNSITTIENEAFEDCEGLTSVTIPNSVTTIGDYAFSRCSGLTLITVPNSVTTIGKSAFYGCSGLTSPIYNANCFAYMPKSYLGAYTIPEGIKQIAGYAFIDCTGLTSITIPNSVTEIGEGSFWGCNELTSITIGNSVTTIGYMAFDMCFRLTSIVWNAINCTTTHSSPFSSAASMITSFTFGNEVETIPAYLCHGMSKLTSVTIPNSVTTIGNYAFYYCSGLTSVTIGNSVTTIEGAAFHCCSGLTKTNYTGTIADWCKIKFEDFYSNPNSYSHHFFINDVEITNLVIPNSVTTIKDYAFHCCDGLTSVTIPNSVTMIGREAFFNCPNLTSVTIGNSITTIGEWAFEYCTGLTSITCYAINPPICGDYCFNLVDRSIPLYVPAQSVDAYQQAEEWKAFTNIQPIAAEEVPVTEPIATPDNHSVTITWPQIDNADTYTLEIRKNGELVCTLTFNNQGIMTNITFAAPARGGERTASNAELTTNGYKFTVTGLEPGTEYTYTITAKNTSAQPLQTYSGSFKTTTPTGLENLTIDKKVSNKFIYGNQLYLRRGDKIYNAVGGAVR